MSEINNTQRTAVLVSDKVGYRLCCPPGQAAWAANRNRLSVFVKCCLWTMLSPGIPPAPFRCKSGLPQMLLMLRLSATEMSSPREDQATVHVENPKLDVLFLNRK